MTEVFSQLAVISAPMEDEVKVILLASLPDPYDILITALVATVEVPRVKIVNERLLHEERKLQDKDKIAYGNDNIGMISKAKHQHGCYGCSEIGHIWCGCPQQPFLYHKSKKLRYRGKISVHKANRAEARWISDNRSYEAAGLVADHVFSTTCEPNNKWIVDSGAICHICLDISLKNIHC